MSTTCASHDAIAGIGDTYSYSTLPAPGFAATVVDTAVPTPGNTDFPFKPFFSGAGILIDETTNAPGITISYTGAPGLPYTYSTVPVVGTQATVVAGQVGNDFRFKPFLEGVGIDVSEDANSITVASTLTTDTVPAAFDATTVAGQSGNTFLFRGIAAGSGITVSQAPDLITIEATGTPTSNLFQNNTVFVDQDFGNDGTGTRERRDLPFQTISAAIAAAVANDTVHVFNGIFNENLLINKELSMYCEDGVFLEALSPGTLFTVDPAVINFSLSGYATMSSNVPGQFLMNGGGILQNFIRCKNVFCTSAGLFTNMGPNCYIWVDNITTTIGPVFTDCPSVRLIAHSVALGDLLYTRSGGNALFNATINSLNCPGRCIFYNGPNCNITINANRITGASGTTDANRFIDVTDTDVSVSRSNVVVAINANYAALDQNLAICSSNKPLGSYDFYPTVYLRFGSWVSTGPANVTHLLCNIGSYNVIAGNMSFVSAPANSAVGVLCTGNGALYVKCSGKLNYSGTSVNTVILNTGPAIFDCGEIVFSGRIGNAATTSLVLKAGTLLGIEDSRIEGISAVIDVGNATLSNATQSIISGFGSTVLGGNYLFNLGAANSAIANPASINVAVIECTFPGNGRTSILSGVNSNISVRRLINTYLTLNNVANSMTINIGHITNTITSTAPTIQVTNGRFSGRVERIDQSGASFVIAVSGGNATLNVGSINASGAPSAIAFASVGGSLLLNAGALTISSSSACSVISNSSANVVGHIGFIDGSDPNCNTIFAVANGGASNYRVSVNRVQANGTIFSNISSNDAVSIHCQSAASTTGGALFSFNNSTANVELSGSYRTTGANVITVNTPNTLSLTVQAAKLISTGNCITTTAPMNLFVVPSIATNPAGAGVTIVPAGALLTNPLIV